MKRTIRTAFAILAGCLGALSCDKYDLVGFVASSSDGPDKRFATSMEYNGKHGYASLNIDSDTYEVYIASDSHIKKEGRKLDAFVSAYSSHCDAAPVVLFLGDAVDGEGYWDSFMNSISPVTLYGNLFVTAGNHDLYFGQWPEYTKRFGTSTYWFELVCPSAKDLYISLDSASGTLGTDQRAWVENILKEKAAQYRNVIVFTHTHFFKRDNKQGHTGNYALEETYDLLSLFSSYGVDLVLTAHRHVSDEQDYRGVKYLTTDCLCDDESPSGYLICKVGGGIDFEFKSL